MFEKIKAILGEVLQVEPQNILPDLRMNDIAQWDSLTHVNLMLFLEQEYGIEISEDVIIQCTSVPGIVDVVSSHA